MEFALCHFFRSTKINELLRTRWGTRKHSLLDIFIGNLSWIYLLGPTDIKYSLQHEVLLDINFVYAHSTRIKNHPVGVLHDLSMAGIVLQVLTQCADEVAHFLSIHTRCHLQIVCGVR